MTWPVVLLLGGAAGIGYSADAMLAAVPVSFTTDKLGFDCRIKGNVSIDSGERIFHVPGQRYYDQTVIRSEFGERWFCSEGDATRAGWRRSRV